MRGYKDILNELVNDEDYKVRSLIASHGYGLDILVNDENEYVRKTAKSILKEK